MGYPDGVKYVVPITINRTKIGEAATNFLYQIDLSATLSADTVFKSYITTAANIIVWDGVSKKPRYVVLDLTNNKLFIYFDGDTSTLENKVFYICVGSDVNEINVSTTFSNSNIINFWGLDESSGSIAPDYVGGLPLTVLAPASFGVGFFSQQLNCSNGYATAAGQPLSGKTSFTVSMVLKFVSVDGTQVIFANRSALTEVQFFIAGTNLIRLVLNTSNIADIVGVSIDVNLYHLINIVFTGGGSGNAGRIKIYIDGVSQSLTFTGTIPSVINAFSGNLRLSYPGAPFSGSIDNTMITSAMSEGLILTQYNMLFNSSTFYNIRRGFKLGGSKRHSIHTGVSVSV